MTSQKVAEETGCRDSIRPKESSWEVIWELEVQELCSEKETVTKIVSQFQDQVFIYFCGLKSWS